MHRFSLLRLASTAFLPAALLALAAPGCAAGPALPGVDPGEPPLILKPDWRLDLNAGVPLSLRPAADGFLVITREGRLLFVDGEAGEVSWESRLEVPLDGEPTRAVRGGNGGPGWLAVPVPGEVIILSTADGRVLSRRDRPPGSVHLTAVPQGLLVAGPGESLALVEAASGRPVWRTRLPSPASAPAAACGMQIVVGMEDGRVAGVEEASGDLRWSRKLKSPAEVRPECSDRHLIVATADNRVHALRLRRRRAGRMWRTRTGADPAAPPVLREDTVLLLSKDTYLYGLKRRNGHLIFRIRLGRRPSPAAILEELVLISGVQAARLEAYRLPLGLNAGGFDLPAGSRFVTPPAVSGGRVALAVARFGETEASTLIALDAAPAERDAARPRP